MTDPSELWVSGGGSTVVATDVMRADIESFAAISSGLATVGIQLAIADATLTDTARAMTQVAWGRAAMDEAWAAMTTARDITDFLGTQLAIAVENYTETEQNVQAMALAVDRVVAFAAGSYLGSNPAFAAVADDIPGLVRLLFAQQTEPLGAYDVEISPAVNAALADPEVVGAIRRFVMTGEDFVAGYGGVPAATAEQLQAAGLSGIALTSQLLIMYAGQAGLLRESSVAVSQTASYERNGPLTSTAQQLGAIPDPAMRADGAQIRIDEIHDGGTVRYEVFIAGTADFDPLAGAEPFDTTSNLAAVAGGSPASYRAVQLAMEQAGITGSSAVTFVGHSQGGLIASMLAASGQYNTQGVISIGGPSGQVVIPPGVPALLIEHFEDPIPALGGTQANTDAVIVQRHAFSAETPPDLGLPLPGHQLRAYLETAELIDRAESTLLQQTVAELLAHSAGDTVTSTWYRAERVP